MSGLSARAVERIELFEAKDALQPWERGEVRAFLLSKPSPEQRARLDRLMKAPVTEPPEGAPAPAAKPETRPVAEQDASYAKGVERAKVAAARRFRT